MHSATFATPLHMPSLAMARRSTRVCAAQQPSAINPSIRKDEAKVVDKVDVSGEDKPQVFCRCWRSGTFPMCDAAHVKHNEATGDNVGPLITECGKK